VCKCEKFGDLDDKQKGMNRTMDANTNRTPAVKQNKPTYLAATAFRRRHRFDRCIRRDRFASFRPLGT
jgi:hypothetical protein